MGRPAGSRNKPKRRLLALLQEQYPDYHPVLELAKIANDKDADPRARFDANKEVAKYVEPVMKAVHTTDGGDQSFEEWLDELEDSPETQD